MHSPILHLAYKFIPSVSLDWITIFATSLRPWNKDQIKHEIAPVQVQLNPFISSFKGICLKKKILKMYFPKQYHKDNYFHLQMVSVFKVEHSYRDTSVMPRGSFGQGLPQPNHS